MILGRCVYSPLKIILFCWSFLAIVDRIESATDKQVHVESLKHEAAKFRYFPDDKLNQLTWQYFSNLTLVPSAHEIVSRLLDEARIRHPKFVKSSTFAQLIDPILNHLASKDAARKVSNKPQAICSYCSRHCNRSESYCGELCDIKSLIQCSKCPVCPIPAFCPKPSHDIKCPPPPNCPNCDSSISLRSSQENSTKAGNDTNTEISSTHVAFMDRKFHLNATIGFDLEKIIKVIVDTAGGSELDVSIKILTSLGVRLSKYSVFKSSLGRTFTYNTARSNAATILAEIIDRINEGNCRCDKCPSSMAECDCSAYGQSQQCSKSTKCTICPPTICAAPRECTQHPACPDCQHIQIGVAYHGKETSAHLDDIDSRWLIEDQEFDTKTPCKKLCKFEQNCGKAPLNPLTPANLKGYMNGGEDSIYGEWPSFVHVDFQKGGGIALCGGVLISDRHVLSAGHCANGSDDYPDVRPKDVKVFLGEHERNVIDVHELRSKAVEVCISNNFSDPRKIGSRFDYSVLTLEHPITFNDYIQPACLPYESNQISDSHCFVVGLGMTKYNHFYPNDHSFSTQVQKMQVKRVLCRSWGFRENDRSRHCFTKANGRGDTCGGDSGGPILCLDKRKRWTVVGLVSYGLEACDGSGSVGWTGVYTRVPQLLKFIQDDCGI